MVTAFVELARRRRSTRSFRADPVPPYVLERLVEAARWAPTGMNMQPWEFVVVTDRTLCRRLGRNAFYCGIYSAHVGAAPAIIAVCMNKRRGPFVRDDCCAAATCILLAAADMGLGACWVGGIRKEAIAEILGLPRHMEVLCLIPVGYPADRPSPPPKRPLLSLLHWNGWRSQKPRDAATAWGPLSVLLRFLKAQLAILWPRKK